MGQFYHDAYEPNKCCESGRTYRDSSISAPRIVHSTEECKSKVVLAGSIPELVEPLGEEPDRGSRGSKNRPSLPGIAVFCSRMNTKKPRSVAGQEDRGEAPVGLRDHPKCQAIA